MYGIPHEADLSFFRGRTLQQICISAHDIEFLFDEGCSLAVESSLRYRNADGTAEDFYLIRRDENEPAAFEKIPVLLRFLNETVIDVEWNRNGTLTLRFEEAGTLEIYDDSENFESWQAASGQQFLVV